MARLAILVLLLVTLVGCSGDSYDGVTLEGNISIDGTPVPKGAITFTPLEENRGPVVGTKIEAGRYHCEQIPLGRVQATFVAHAAETQSLTDISTGTTHQVPKDILPKQYRTGIVVTVTEEMTSHDFTLNSQGD